MLNRIIKTIVLTGCLVIPLLMLSCSLFPDKETQYLQHTELDTLELPPDLQQTPETIQANVQQIQPEENSDDQTDINTTDTYKNEMPLLVDLIKEPIHIEIFDNFEHTWNRVGKTLTHMGLEVLDRDKNNGQYFVVYEKAPKPVDDSLWSFLAFWRDDGRHEEFDFRVKLLEDRGLTKILVLDADEQPVREGPGRTLLLDIYQAL
ncbi:MAG TPA: outer membrane protein assembly factor BamC [Crenotrichaceae bacterium]|nr:outer membrane protein assembly factor BamC [Crenotrichaceae bacterium]